MRFLPLILLLTSPLLAQDEIRDARAASNRAIEARALPAYTATITADFTITTGSGLAYTHDSFVYLWKNLFADPLWLGPHRPQHLRPARRRAGPLRLPIAPA